MRTWQGSPPVDCDICHRPLVGEFIDGKIVGGGWCMMCTSCHGMHGTSLGQTYRLLSGVWVDTRDIPRCMTEKQVEYLQRLANPYDHIPDGKQPEPEED